MRATVFTGILYVRLDGTWEIAYNFNDTYGSKILPLYPGDVKKLNCNELSEQVNFTIIDEFTNPELYRDVPLFDGIKYAKLVEETEAEDFNLGIIDFFKNLYNKIFKK